MTKSFVILWEASSLLNPNNRIFNFGAFFSLKRVTRARLLAWQNNDKANRNSICIRGYNVDTRKKSNILGFRKARKNRLKNLAWTRTKGSNWELAPFRSHWKDYLVNKSSCLNLFGSQIRTSYSESKLYSIWQKLAPDLCLKIKFQKLLIVTFFLYLVAPKD